MCIRDRIKSLSLVCIFGMWHSMCHKLHALSNHHPDAKCVSGFFTMFSTIFRHRTWYSVHTLSLNALQFSSTFHYYNDYRIRVDKLAIKAHTAVSTSNPDTRTLYQCAKHMSKPNIRSPKSIRFKSGQVAFSRSQVSQRWSEHFCDLFLGNETTWSSLLHHSKSNQL